MKSEQDILNEIEDNRHTNLKKYYKSVYNCLICKKLYGVDHEEQRADYKSICSKCVNKLWRDKK